MQACPSATGQPSPPHHFAPTKTPPPGSIAIVDSIRREHHPSLPNPASSTSPSDGGPHVLRRPPPPLTEPPRQHRRRAPPRRRRRGGAAPARVVVGSDGPHQERGGGGDGEPLLRPHAGLDEAAEPGDRRRHRRRVEPGQHDGPGRRAARLLRRGGPVRGPGPGPLVPGDPPADLRLRRRVGTAEDERLRPAGPVAGRQHDRRRHERVRARQRRRLPRARRAVRRLRQVVRVRAVVHPAQPDVRPLRHVRRRHQQQPRASGEGLPAAHHLRQHPRRGPFVRRLLPGRAGGALLPQPPQAQVPPRLPPVPPHLRRPRPPGLPPQLRRHRAALPRLQALPRQRRPPLPRRLPGPDVRQGDLRDPPRQPAVEPDAHGPHLRRARRLLRPRPHPRPRRPQPRRNRRPAAVQLHLRPPRCACSGHPHLPVDRKGDGGPRAEWTDANIAVRALVHPGHREEALRPAARFPDQKGRLGRDIRERRADKNRAQDGLPRATPDADEDQANRGERGGQAQRVPAGDHPARVGAQRGPRAHQPAGQDQGQDERQGRHRLHEGRRQALLRGWHVGQADGRQRRADRQDEAFPHHQDSTSPIETLTKTKMKSYIYSRN